jgi:hypothetical protein
LNNTFTFENGSFVSGWIDGSSQGMNTLNFANDTDVVVELATATKGMTFAGSARINDFDNINNLIGNGQDAIQFTGNNNLLVITGALKGFIDDPTTFTGFNTFSATNEDSTQIIFNVSASFDTLGTQAFVNGFTLQFHNINFSDNLLTQINGTLNSSIDSSIFGVNQNTASSSSDIPVDGNSDPSNENILFSGSPSESSANLVITINNNVTSCTSTLTTQQSQTDLTVQGSVKFHSNC